VRIKSVFLFILVSTLIVACGPSEAAIATAIAQTEAARPTAIPTRTPEPVVVLPDVVHKLFSDAKSIHQLDSFGALPGFSPADWGADQTVYVREDGSLEITGANNVVFYGGESINVNEAIITGFKFADNSIFTIGMDRQENNSRIPYGQPDFRTISAEFRGTPSVNLHTDKGHTRYGFKGDLELQPDTWYLITIGLTTDKQFVVKIWSPENPEESLVYNTQSNDMPNQYYFIMWVDANSTFYLKDFTIIKFSKLLLE
jgi:hypothetical protein